MFVNKTEEFTHYITPRFTVILLHWNNLLKNLDVMNNTSSIDSTDFNQGA